MASGSPAINKIERAHQMYREGNYAEALDYYTDALSMAKTTPQKIALHSNRAACFLKLHDFNKVSCIYCFVEKVLILCYFLNWALLVFASFNRLILVEVAKLSLLLLCGMKDGVLRILSKITYLSAVNCIWSWLNLIPLGEPLINFLMQDARFDNLLYSLSIMG